MPLNFWELHGLLFIAAMFFFPRLALIFLTAWGGLFWRTGLIIAPRLSIALIATVLYLSTNPILVCLTWIWAIVGELLEKEVVASDLSPI